MPDSPSPTARPSSYIPGLDGIRALAVLLVFAYHGQYLPMIPGELGTTAFFFLSGFLITTLFVREHRDTGDIRLGAFYFRRILRLLPVLYIALGAAWLASFFLKVGGPLETWHVLGNFFQFTNYSIVGTMSRYGTLPGMILLWSLAVDEHFYIVFAPFFKAAFKRISLESIARFLLFLCGLCLAWRCYLIVSIGHTSFRETMATDTRMDSILWGAFLALWRNPALNPERAKALTKPWLVALAFVCLLIPEATRSWTFRGTVGYTLEGIAFIPLFCAAIMQAKSGFFRFLEWPWLRWIGRISYPLYLFQWLIIDITYKFMPAHRGIQFVTAFVVTLLLSALIHLMVERPLARLRRATQRKHRDRRSAEAAPLRGPVAAEA